MASMISEQIAVDAAVRDFLVRHGAEAEFQKVAELAQDCFPELLGLEATWQEDPDEVGRSQVILHVRLPESLPSDVLSSRQRRYHERLVLELPLSRCPLFALVTDFGPE